MNTNTCSTNLGSNCGQSWCQKMCNCGAVCPRLESLTLLLIRLFLFFPLFEAGWTKVTNFQSTVEWFGNADWGLGLPLPALLAGLATGAELIGAALLLVGLFTRWAAIPLLVVMVVAAVLVHATNGWPVIATDQSLWFGTMPGADRLAELEQAIVAAGMNNPLLLQAYDAATGYGSLAVLNNGVEFAVTYALFLLVLLVYGAGRLSLDGCCRAWRCRTSKAMAMTSGSCCPMMATDTVMPALAPAKKAMTATVKPAAKKVVAKPAAKKPAKKTAKRRR